LRLDRWLPRFINPSEIKEVFENFRRSHCKESTYPLEIELVVEKKLHLQIIPTAGIRALIGIDAFLRSDFSAIVVDNQEYLDDRHQNRLRFSIAHEVGHFVLHAKTYKEFGIQSASDYVNVIQNLSEKAYSALEWQANQFAGNILVPREDLAVALLDARKAGEHARLASKLKDDPEQMLALLTPSISRKFGVSEDVIARRVRDEKLWP
jgi:Zn-dependent peptidase ImmA (M78 family)